MAGPGNPYVLRNAIVNAAQITDVMVVVTGGPSVASTTLATQYRGSYLVTHQDGTNEIVSATDFANLYVAHS